MRCHLSHRLAILSLSGLMLAGCAPSLGSLAVDLKGLKQCRRLDPAVRPPKIDGQSDYRAVAADALAGVKKANSGTASRNQCEDRFIDEYAAAK